MKRFASAWPLLVLFLLPILALNGAFGEGRTLGPHGQITGNAGRLAWDILPIDGVLQFYGWRKQVFQAWGRFEIPLWNPYALGGTPLLQNSQSGAFYPLHILVGLTQMPTWLGITILGWFHLFWAGLGVYWLCRSLGAKELGGTIAGASFMLSPFMLGWLSLPSVPTTVAWIPWLLYGVVRIVRAEGFPGFGVGVTGLSLGMMILAGHLQFVAYGGMALGLWAVLLLAQRFRLAAVGGVALAALLGGVIGLAHLMPVLEYSEFSHRRNAPSEEGFQAYQASSIRLWELGNLFNPTALGNPRIPAQADSDVSTYWPQLAKLGGNWAESALSPGPVALVLLILIPFAWRRLKDDETDLQFPLLALLILGLFGLLMALGTPLNRLLYFGVPGWSSTGSPGRAVVLFVMAMSVMAGLVADHLGRDRLDDRMLRFGLLAFLVAGFGSVSLGLSQATPLPMVPEALFRPVSGVATAVALPMTFLLLAVAAQVPVLLRLPALAKYQPGVALGGVVLCGLIWGAAGIVPTGQPALDAPDFGDARAGRVAVINQNWSLWTRAGTPFIPNLPGRSGYFDLAGYDSLLHRDTKAMLDEINGGDSAAEANGNLMFIKPSADRIKLAEAGVRTVVLFENNEVRTETLEGPGWVSSAAGSVEARWSGNGRIEIKVDHPQSGLVTVRERAMRGWHLHSQGSSSVPLTEGRWIQFEVPPGQHVYQLIYRPQNLEMYMGLSGVILAGLVILVLRPARAKSSTV